MGRFPAAEAAGWGSKPPEGGSAVHSQGIIVTKPDTVVIVTEPDTVVLKKYRNKMELSR